MSLEFTIDKKDIQKLLNKLSAIIQTKVIKESLWQGGQHIAGWIKTNRLTGPRPQFLGVITNRLRSSIATSKPETIAGGYQVKIGTNVKYGPIHEYGGIIRGNPYLRFKVSSGTRVLSKRGGLLKRPQTIFQWVTVKQVTIPARPFMRPGIESQDNQDWVVSNFKKNIETEIEKA